jgi:hypothetical protein
MAFFLSPIGNAQQSDANGDPLVGGKIYTYLAGTTTAAATYTTSAGSVAQANPIILNSLGLPDNPIWLTGGVSYKLVIKTSADVTLRTVDNIAGVNDITGSTSEWVESGFVPTYVSATSFSVPGDQTTTLAVGRRLQTRNTSGLVYSRISVSSFAAAVTTVTVVNDSTTLDSGLSAVSYGLASPVNPSLPNSAAVRETMGISAAIQNQTNTAYTTAGTATAYTLTPSPAITAYAAGQSFFVTFNAASGAAPTLTISGVATPPNLVKQIAAGTYANIAAGEIPTNHRSPVTLLSATQALVESLPFAVAGPNNTPLSFRNRLANARFTINQRAVSGAVVLGAGVYGHDRWKAGAAGCSYTIGTTGNDSYLDISAGSLIQVIAVGEVEGGVYALSHQGTSQARIAVNGAATSGAYAAATQSAPLLSATATANQQISVEFNAGTVFRPQFEPGTMATPFERPPDTSELLRCQRRLIRYTSAARGDVAIGLAYSTTQAVFAVPLPAGMTAAPTINSSNLYVTNGAGVQIAGTSLASANFTGNSVLVDVGVAAGLTVGQASVLSAGAAAGGYIQFEDEL